MKITCKFFALLRDRTGVAETAIELPDAATLSTATSILAEKFPAISDHLARVAFAVNREYVSGDAVLHEGDELALIPPVSGGCR